MALIKASIWTNFRGELLARHGYNAHLYKDRLAGLAQLVVHLICNQGVGGSSPSAGTIYAFTDVQQHLQTSKRS
jgi:hypothetical protein